MKKKRSSSPIYEKINPDYSNENQDREDMIKNNLHLVKFVLSRFINQSYFYGNNEDFYDLFSCGVIGLIEAVDGFDVTRQVKFSTYAIPRIRGAIIDELRARDILPRLVRQKVNEIQKTFAEIEKEKLRPATDGEVLEKLGYNLEEYHEVLKITSFTAILSLDEEVKDFWDGKPVNRVELVSDLNSTGPREFLAREEMIDLLANGISELPEKERIVITLYYNEEMTFKEIGEVLGVTESRVCQLHSKAALKLKSRLSRFKEEFWQSVDDNGV